MTRQTVTMRTSGEHIEINAEMAAAKKRWAAPAATRLDFPSTASGNQGYSSQDAPYTGNSGASGVS
jgi:hypothetical protein